MQEQEPRRQRVQINRRWAASQRGDDDLERSDGRPAMCSAGVLLRCGVRAARPRGVGYGTLMVLVLRNASAVARPGNMVWLQCADRPSSWWNGRAVHDAKGSTPRCEKRVRAAGAAVRNAAWWLGQVQYSLRWPPRAANAGRPLLRGEVGIAARAASSASRRPSPCAEQALETLERRADECGALRSRAGAVLCFRRDSSQQRSPSLAPVPVLRLR
ncbi:hypothetical protein PSPO01_07503 [Paraphaeosphaeria sporulosa]